MRFVVAVAALLVAAPAFAAQYPGWGDTGWLYAGKRDCCIQAIAIAQDYSARACMESGGQPRPTTGQQRGTCQAQWMQDPEGNMMYRCYGEAAVWCR